MTKLQTTNPPQANNSVIPSASERSITILVELYKTEKGKILKTHALINSGATICCIDDHLTKQMK